MKVLNRVLAPALLLVGLAASGAREHVFDSINPWSLIFVGTTATALAIWLRRRSFGVMVVSLPFWVMANTHGAFMAVAVALTIGGLALVAVGPTLPGRTIRRDVPVLAHLAQGPLVPVASATYGGERSRVLTWMARGFALIAVVLIVASAGGGDPAVTGGLGLSSVIIAVTFAGSNWCASRMRLRIDARGLHSRVLLGEKTVLWSELAGVTLRYVFFPGSGLRVVYYVAFSPTREFAFTHGMQGSAELRSTIERASGLSFPVPEVDSHF